MDQSTKMTRVEDTVHFPIVIEMGKTRRSRIKQLKRGKGKLMDEVAQVMEDVLANLGKDAASTRLVPVVIVYTKKKSKRNRVRLPVPFGL